VSQAFLYLRSRRYAGGGHINQRTRNFISTRSIGGGNEDEVQMSEAIVEPTWDGTNDVIAISAGSAIA